MIVEAVRLDALANYERQFPHPRERSHGAMAVIGHRQGLAALFTALFERDEDLLLRRFRARSSSSHALSPVGVVCLLLLPGYTCRQPRFAIQQKTTTAILAEANVVSI